MFLRPLNPGPTQRVQLLVLELPALMPNWVICVIRKPSRRGLTTNSVLYDKVLSSRKRVLRM